MGKARGDVNIRAGSIVKLVGLGERFSQTYYVYAARHVLTLWGYVTYFLIDANVGNPGAQSQSDAQASAQAASSESGAEEGATAEENGTSETSEDDSRNPEITNLKWTDLEETEIDSALVLDKVLMYADVRDIDDGTWVKLYIYEQEKVAEDKFFMQTSTTVKEGKIVFETPIICIREIDEDAEEEPDELKYVFAITEKKNEIREESPELLVKDEIDVEVSLIHDMDLPESWDDKCKLWTVKDDGEKYSEEVNFSDQALVTVVDNKVKVKFEKVLPERTYSCSIDLGNDDEGQPLGEIMLFSGVKIKRDMGIIE